MQRSIVKLSAAGDTTVAEWDTETVSEERLAEIEAGFRSLITLGYTPADITDKKDVIRHDFSPEADYLMIPRMVGG